MRNFFKNLTIDLLLISTSSILAGCVYSMLYIIVNLIMGSVVWNTILCFVLVFINILVPLLMVSFKNKINIINRRYKKEESESFRVFLTKESSMLIALFIVLIISVLFENSKFSFIYFSVFALNQLEMFNFIGYFISVILILLVYCTYSYATHKNSHFC